MSAYVRACLVLALLLSAAGCASNNAGQDGQPSLEADGWTRMGEVSIPQDDDQHVLAGNQLPGMYQSICLQTDGPAEIRRFGVVFPDGTTYQPEQGTKFEGAGTQVIQLPGERRQIGRVILVHSGGGLIRPTRLTVWVK